jgi:glucan 1,3-beta-glucosidase
LDFVGFVGFFVENQRWCQRQSRICQQTNKKIFVDLPSAAFSMLAPVRILAALAALCAVAAVHANDGEPTAKDKPTTPAPTPAPTEAVKDAKWYWQNEADPRFAAATGNFSSFKAHDDTRTCSRDTHSTPFNRQVRGANLGGWLVLEPWITPSLFYQFLGTQERFGDKAPEKTGMDSYTFCTALGPEEANRQLRVHWANWVTEADIKEMAEAGVNSLRVPVGDWMFSPYEPFVGCTDGAIEELDRVADLALKYDIDLLLDIHGLIDSQNGFDNSGRTSAVKWTSIASTQPVGTTTFEHWPIRQAGWAGTYDPETRNYSSINYGNLNQSLTAVENIIHRYAAHPAILGLQPVNEPWELTPIEVLKNYYWKSYKRVKVLAPHWKFVLHDSFRFGLQYWSEFMKGCPDIALDTHIYQAWMNPGTKADYFANACQQKYTLGDMENALMPVIVGEWSLGTDNCAMWLNGFNDNLPGFPKVICQLKKCPVQSTYLGNGFPGTPLDVTKPIQGPYGTGTSGPSFGLCPVNSNVTFGQTKPEDEVEFMRNLNLKKLNAFAVGHGWYFWNFKTELDTRWDFLQLIRLGAFPKNVSAYSDEDGVFDACDKEDKGEFVCRAKRGVKRYELVNGLAYACNADAVDCSDIKTRFLTLEEQCDWAFNEYWQSERLKGATCDFGGAAHLLSIPISPEEIIARSTADKGTSAVGANTSLLALVIGGVAIVAVVAVVVVRVLQRRRRRDYRPIDRSA